MVKKTVSYQCSSTCSL